MGRRTVFRQHEGSANAAIDRLIPRVVWEAQQHLHQLFQEKADSLGTVTEIASSVAHRSERVTILTPQDLGGKYNGARLTGVRKPSYERLTDQEVCPTDPDASPMHPSGGGSAIMGYSDHSVVDGSKQRIILHAMVTPASIMDNTPLLDVVRLVCIGWQLHPQRATGDTKYGTVPNIVGLEQMGIHAYHPTTDLSSRTNFYPADDFNTMPRTTNTIVHKAEVKFFLVP